MESLRAWQGLPSERPSLRTLAPRFSWAYDDSVARHRDQTFVVCYDARGVRTQKSYGEFDADVRAARAEVRAAREPGTEACATLAANTYPHLVFLGAILLEGLTLCPLNPDDPPARVRQKLAQLPPATPVFGAGIEGARPLRWSDGRDPGPPPDRAPDGAWISVFTSGSTGHSKVVEQLESGVLQNVDALIERHALGPGNCVATAMPVFHVNALEFSFLATLLSGAKLVLFERFQLGPLAAALPRENVRILSAIPQMIGQLLERTHVLPPGALATLDYVVTAAAPLPPAYASAALAAFPFRVLQGYGLSEAVNFSTLLPRDLSDDEHRRWTTGFDRPSIGTALRGNEVLVLGDDGRELAEREVGELCVRGHTVMRGYRGDERREVFAGGVLHTGDLGYYVNDPARGRFFFHAGRRKDVIKRLGETVSLVEVDELLLGLEGAEGIAVGFEHRDTGEEVAVALRLAAGREPPVAELRRRFAASLPAAQAPKVALVVSESLTTSSGKPCRWKFREALAPYREKVLGGLLVVDLR
jgi:acyl-CoA synthetase (AMP-forming)/AMP-acid ligase II